ncbi:SDR family oxidoreductase [Amycolatopsis sp. GM8]|uniref:SDR family oxidoreductase n=1 Tax=Amycolatopsis sp. GM8 TaxID=2896530 RepID=UPI001EEC2FCB|nr:SDR family oxidoreductase [Amycolatopsis sp. GM8]
MTGLLDGQTTIVTGAGSGIGRAEALELARQGARVVVADLGVALDGSGGSASVADAVVDEITELGGVAVACRADVGDWNGSQRVIDTAIRTFGGIDVIVNNAGIIRDKMMFNMDEDDFDAVIRVHLKGTFSMTRWASIYWRKRQKEGLRNDARIINTCSPAGLYGSAGQANYSAAKAGIACMTIGAARELARYGVTANAISPVADTRMTATLQSNATTSTTDGWDPRSPDNVAPLVAWLASAESADVTGQVFEVGGGSVGVAEGWRHGPTADKGARWDPAELGPVMHKLVSEAYQVPVPGGGAAR